MEELSSNVAAAPPPPLDLSHHFSLQTKHRQPSAIKSFYKFFQVPGIGNLAGGMPNVEYFPFDTLEAQVARPARWKPTPNYPPQQDAIASSSAGASHMTIPKELQETDPIKKLDLATALQYGQAAGYPPLHSFIRQFTRECLHPNVPYLNGVEVIMTCGATDGFAKAIEMIVEPWFPERDHVRSRPGMLCETFVYGNVLTQVRPNGVQVVPVEIDGQGMLAKGTGGLEDVLENWDPRNGRRPHFLYSVTMGHNPTSGVLSVERRKEIYKLCCKYDIIIIEDDPYWYLQFPSAVQQEAQSRSRAVPQVENSYKPTKSSGYEFLDSLAPSYLNFDTEGRVIRLDTFSKTVAPGCRLGWITAQPAFIERLERITETTTQQPSGFVQAMIAELVIGSQPEATKTFFGLSSRDKLKYNGWNVDGWVRWLAGLRGEYERRMARMCTILDNNSYQLKQSTPVNKKDTSWGVITKTQLISFDWPRGGMFVWIRIHFESHPLWQAKGTQVPLLDGPALATAFMILCTHKPHLVLGAPGSMFCPTPEIQAERGWAYLRLCFAAVSDEDVDACTTRLANTIQRFWRIKKVAEVEKLIKELETTNVEEVEGIVDLGHGVMGC